MKTQTTFSLAFLLFLFPSVLLATSDDSLQATPNSHPFFKKMFFLGESFEDPKNEKCVPGFIGWYQEDEGAEPIMIIPNDALRNIVMDCKAADLNSKDISCLKENRIQRRVITNGKLYTTTLTMTSSKPEALRFELTR